MPTKNTLGLFIAASIMAGCASKHVPTTRLHGLNIQCQSHQAVAVSEISVSGLELIGTHIADSDFDTSAAEIVSYDRCTDKLYVVNAQASRIDVLALDPNGKPSNGGAIDLQHAARHAHIAIGAANSVATHQGLVAVAIENQNKQASGIIALYRSDSLDLINTFPAGALPDMVGFSKDGRYIAAANEGEPSADYNIDPDGSITLIDLKPGLIDAPVKQINFRDFNGGGTRHAELTGAVRISGPNATVSQDLEPEYLTFADNGKLYVALQENNAIAAIDLEAGKVDAIYGLGSKSWFYSELDASNKDKKVGNFHRYPLLEGLFMPDTISSYSVNGSSYIVTANEGDGREYGFKTSQKICDKKGYEWDEDDLKGTSEYDSQQGFCLAYSDEIRGKKIAIEAEHNLAEALKDNKRLARLKLINDQHNQTGKKIAVGEPIYAFGTRSFSIFDESGELVFDSGDQFAQIAFAREGENFNSSNDNNSSGDDRSDDKGTEPEAIEIAKINGRHYAFIGLERQGGIMIYDISNPKDPLFINYSNNRNYNLPVCTKVDDGDCESGRYNPLAGDLGPESIEYFTRSGQHFLAVGNEVSGTTSVYKIKL